jgi:hypothetical protein
MAITRKGNWGGGGMAYQRWRWDSGGGQKAQEPPLYGRAPSWTRHVVGMRPAHRRARSAPWQTPMARVLTAVEARGVAGPGRGLGD